MTWEPMNPAPPVTRTEEKEREMAVMLSKVFKSGGTKNHKLQ